MKRAVIVGGGLSGVAAAVALCSRGWQVTLLEREDRLGGRACSFRDATSGDTVDLGPHVLLSAYRNMLDLLHRLGTSRQLFWQHDELLSLTDGRIAVPMRSRRLPAPFPLLPSLLADPQIGFLDKLSAAPLIWMALRAGEQQLLELDHIPAPAFLSSRGAAKGLLDGFWRSLAMFLLNIPLEECSSASLMRLFSHLISHGHVAFGFATTGLADLYAEPARRQIERGGGSLRLGAVVDRLLLDQGCISGLRLPGGEVIPASRCILALPPHELLRLLPPRHGLAPDLRAMRPSPYLSVYLWFSRRLTQRRFWARRWRSDSLSCEYYDLSNIRHPRRPGGSLIATNLIDAGGLRDWRDETIIQGVLDELEEFLPGAQAHLLRGRIHRIPMAVPRAGTGFEHRRPGSRSGIGHVYLAGDWTATALPCSMESAVRSGYLAADTLLQDDGFEGGHALPPPGPGALVRGLRKVWPLRRIPAGIA